MATGDLKEVEPTPLKKLREFLETERDIVAGELDDAWALIAATFEVEVTVLANVIAFKPLRAPKKSRVKASR